MYANYANMGAASRHAEVVVPYEPLICVRFFIALDLWDKYSSPEGILAD